MLVHFHALVHDGTRERIDLVVILVGCGIEIQVVVRHAVIEILFCLRKGNRSRGESRIAQRNRLCSFQSDIAIVAAVLCRRRDGRVYCRGLGLARLCRCLGRGNRGALRALAVDCTGCRIDIVLVLHIALHEVDFIDGNAVLRIQLLGAYGNFRLRESRVLKSNLSRILLRDCCGDAGLASACANQLNLLLDHTSVRGLNPIAVLRSVRTELHIVDEVTLLKIKLGAHIFCRDRIDSCIRKGKHLCLIRADRGVFSDRTDRKGRSGTYRSQNGKCAEHGNSRLLGGRK